MEEHTVGVDESLSENRAEETPEEKRPRRPPPLFTVVPNLNGDGYCSRFDFAAIGLSATGAVRATAEECVPDCMEAMKGLLEQLGIPAAECDVVVARIERLE